MAGPIDAQRSRYLPDRSHRQKSFFHIAISLPEPSPFSHIYVAESGRTVESEAHPTPCVFESVTLRFCYFRHSRARTASGPSPIDSACPKTPRTMLDLPDRSLRRSREAPRPGRPASAAVEAVASTAADAAFTLPSRPSTRNQSLAPLAVHHGPPPGSIGRSQ